MRHARFPLMARAALVLAAAQTLLAQPTPTFNDVQFATVLSDAGDPLALRMDIYTPPGATNPTPLVIWVHGGGWQGGTYQTAPGLALPLLQNGIAVASVQYRLSGTAIFPAQIHDVKGAVRFLRANAATYNLDPSRFAAWGTSAGGHLVALLGTSGGVSAAEGDTGGNTGVSSRVQAVVDFFGPTDLLNMQLDVTTPPGSAIDHDSPASPESRLIGFDDPGQGIGVLRANQSNPAPPFPEKIELITLANPVEHVTPDDPPFFTAHGTNDVVVPIAQSTRLHSALSAATVDVSLTAVAGAGHGPLGTATEQAARTFILQRFATIAPPLPGDMNCDGAVDFFDIDLFLTALFQPLVYNTLQPDCDMIRGDMNGDDRLDFFDVDGFVAALFF